MVKKISLFLELFSTNKNDIQIIPLLFYFYNIFIPETNEDVLLLVKISKIFKFDLSEVYFKTYSKKKYIFQFKYGEDIDALLQCRYMSENLKIFDIDSKCLDMTISVSNNKYFFTILNSFYGIYYFKINIKNPDNLKLFLIDLVNRLKNVNIYEINQNISIEYIENNVISLSVILENNENEMVLNFDKTFKIKYNGYSRFKIIEVLDVVIKDLDKRKYFHDEIH